LTKSFTVDCIEADFTDLAKLASLVAQGICWRSVIFAWVLQRTTGGGRIWTVK